MQTVIIEDNKAAQKSLIRQLEKHCPNVHLCGVAETVETAIALITTTAPELVFLDVELPDGNGFDILESLPDKNFQLIFISSFQQYALQAIKYSALDYLLKPFDYEDLVTAVEKALTERHTHATSQKLDTLRENMTYERPHKLIVKDKHGLQIITINDIFHLEANGSYTEFFIKDQHSLMATKSIKEYQNLLPNQTFFRCHQSFLVNLNHLIRYDKREGDFLVLKNGYKVPLATRKKDTFLKILQ
ncbi:conserved hypothetical protein [Tenacibaculum litopenaei]|uniref:LytR/AlgR family response regulator transcription factor n=1 Tax=Tenacibaculum litopenaei TaxID=396016 RepID=UPI003895B1CE